MRRALHDSRRTGPGSGLLPNVAAAAATLAVVGSLLASPGAPTAVPARGVDSVRIVDDRGDTLRLEGPARRIVSVIPAATEILFALGAGDRVAGRTRYGVHPPEARAVPSVGEGIRPSVEAILALRPDAVVAYAGSSNRRTLARLRELGVPLLALEHDAVDDLRRNVARLGSLTGRPAAADSLLSRLDRDLDRVAELVGREARRSVYYEVWADPPITVGAGSYLDSLISLAGGRNVFGDLSDPSPQVSLESVIAREPEVMIVARDTTARGRRRPPAERPGWRAVAAVREGRVREVDGALVHRLGPRLGDAAAALAAAIHPELAGALRRAGFPVESP